MSQLGADDWVLSNFKKPGFFVDIGCYDAFECSNTAKLEEAGWRGICIDPFPTNFDKRPNSIVEQAVLFSEADKEVEFRLAEGDGKIISGIDSCLDKHKELLTSYPNKLVTMKTKKLIDILDKHNAPKFIEYMNLDVEGAEYDILSTFDFSKYTFGYMSIEHNFEEPKRTMIRTLLESKGYKLYLNMEWDDWYILDSDILYEK